VIEVLHFCSLHFSIEPYFRSLDPTQPIENLSTPIPRNNTMPARLFYDADCPLDPLKGKTLVFVGYGNQGRAQALNIVGDPSGKKHGELWSTLNLL
jgi:hypothetical protein